MTKGLKPGELNGRDVYPDIIDLPHWQSPTRPHMCLYDRSAQFAAYKALSGYEDMVAEEARETDAQVELDETALERLNQKLGLIADVIEDGVHPEVSITYFVPDKSKTGGEYVTVTDKVKKIDAVEGKIVLMSTSGRGGLNKTVLIERLTEIQGELVDYLDDAEF